MKADVADRLDCVIVDDLEVANSIIASEFASGTFMLQPATRLTFDPPPAAMASTTSFAVSAQACVPPLP